MHEWNKSEEENFSGHSYMKYKIWKANNHKNEYNHDGIRYVVKEEKYNKYDRQLEQRKRNFSKI